MCLANGQKNIFFNKDNDYKNRYEIEDFNVYYNRATSNVYLLTQNINENSKVIDLACGQGLMAYGLVGKNCEIYGIDIDKDAIESANKKNLYKNIYIGNIEETKFGLEERQYDSILNADVVILSDILEHVRYPTEIILKSLDLINENGIILISVSNIANSDIVLNLMNGKFNYNYIGILDNTHLKFFTKDSFMQWIELINTTYNLSLSCNYIGSTFYESNMIKKFKRKYPQFYKILSFYEDNNALQILFSISKKGTFKYCEENYRISEKIGQIIEKKTGHLYLSQYSSKNLGEILYLDTQNEYIDSLKVELLEKEKGINWYKEQEDNTKKYINSLKVELLEKEKGINWYKEQEDNTKKYINSLKVELLEKEKGINWYKEQEKKTKEYIESLKVQISSIKEKENRLQEYIFKLENTVIFRIAKNLGLLNIK